MAPCGGYPRPWTPALVSLMLTSTFLLLSHGTLRPAGGGSGLIAMDGGIVACPGYPPACTCAASASLRTPHCCRSPGAQLLGCFPEELCAACTWLPPAFSPASRGPSGTPSRHLWESREARLPRTLGVWAEGPNLDRLPTHRGLCQVPAHLRKFHLLQGVQHPRWGPWSCWDLHGLPRVSRHHLTSLLTKRFRRHFLPRKPRPVCRAGVGVSGCPAGHCTPSPRTQCRCLNVLEPPAC